MKTNSEFRSAETSEENHLKSLSKKQVTNTLKTYININKSKIYNKGYNKYLKRKEKWENENPGKIFPKFNWSIDNPGPDNVDLTKYFEK